MNTQVNSSSPFSKLTKPRSERQKRHALYEAAIDQYQKDGNVTKAHELEKELAELDITEAIITGKVVR